MADRIGTLAWTRRTRGRLSPRERLTLTTRGVASQIRALAEVVVYSTGRGRDGLARLDLESMKLPDSAAAREAEAIADRFPSFIWHHSHRSYLWAAALGARDGLRYDAEFLYIACLMHDAGLMADGRSQAGDCFTLASAAAAERCAAGGDWEESRRERLMEAITLHINPTVSRQEGVEAHLLTVGSTLDALALRGAWRIDPATKSAVLERHPREGLKRELVPLLKAHGRDATRARIAFYLRYGALAQLVKRSGFDE